jgi:hypothetical protein
MFRYTRGPSIDPSNTDQNYYRDQKQDSITHIQESNVQSSPSKHHQSSTSKHHQSFTSTDQTHHQDFNQNLFKYPNNRNTSTKNNSNNGNNMNNNINDNNANDDIYTKNTSNQSTADENNHNYNNIDIKSSYEPMTFRYGKK